MDLNKLKHVVDELQFLNESIKNNSSIFLKTNSELDKNITRLKDESALLNAKKDTISEISVQLDFLLLSIKTDNFNTKSIEDNARLIDSSMSNYIRKMDLMLQKLDHKSHRNNFINLIPWILVSFLIGSITTSTIIKYYPPISEVPNIQLQKGY